MMGSRWLFFLSISLVFVENEAEELECSDAECLDVKFTKDMCSKRFDNGCYKYPFLEEKPRVISGTYVEGAAIKWNTKLELQRNKIESGWLWTREIFFDSSSDRSCINIERFGNHRAGYNFQYPYSTKSGHNTVDMHYWTMIWIKFAGMKQFVPASFWTSCINTQYDMLIGLDLLQSLNINLDFGAGFVEIPISESIYSSYDGIYINDKGLPRPLPTPSLPVLNWINGTSGIDMKKYEGWKKIWTWKHIKYITTNRFKRLSLSLSTWKRYPINDKRFPVNEVNDDEKITGQESKSLLAQLIAVNVAKRIHKHAEGRVGILQTIPMLHKDIKLSTEDIERLNELDSYINNDHEIENEFIFTSNPLYHDQIVLTQKEINEYVMKSLMDDLLEDAISEINE